MGFDAEAVRRSSLNGNDDGVTAGYDWRAIMNEELVVAVLRVKIDRGGPADKLWCLGGDVAKAGVVRIVSIERPSVASVNIMRANKPN